LHYAYAIAAADMPAMLTPLISLRHYTCHAITPLPFLLLAIRCFCHTLAIRFSLFMLDMPAIIVITLLSRCCFDAFASAVTPLFAISRRLFFRYAAASPLFH